MPLPTVADVHVNRPLTNVSIAYKNPVYIADQIFPIVPVQKKTDIYWLFSQSYWFRNDAATRAPGTESKIAGYGLDSSHTYNCKETALGHVIADELRSNVDDGFDLDRTATEFLTDKILLSRELAFITDFFTTSVWTTDKTGGTDFTQWSNFAGSSPIVDLDSFKDTVEGYIAREPNTLVLGKQVWLQLKNHPDLLDQIKYTQKGQISVDLFASLVEIPKVLIGRAIYTSTPEGTAEASVSYSRAWGKHGLLLYVADRPTLMTPSAGYTFTWQVVPNALNYARKRYDEAKRGTIIECGSYYDQVQTAASAGLFMSGAVA